MRILCVCFLLCFFSLRQVAGQKSGSAANQNNWAYDLLGNQTRQSSTPGKKIVIAVVDDGFRFSHRDLAHLYLLQPRRNQG